MCSTQVWQFHRSCFCTSVREASSLSDWTVLSALEFLDLPDSLLPLEFRVVTREPCLAGFLEEVIRIIVLGRYHFCKSHMVQAHSVPRYMKKLSIDPASKVALCTHLDLDNFGQDHITCSTIKLWGILRYPKHSKFYTVCKKEIIIRTFIQYSIDDINTNFWELQYIHCDSNMVLN